MSAGALIQSFNFQVLGEQQSMLWFLVFLGASLSGTRQAQASRPYAAMESHFGTSKNVSRQLQATGDPHACRALKTGKLEKGVVSSAHAACFSIEVKPGEAQQLTVSQPEDMEIHVTGRTFERLVDGFDMGVETITLRTAGPYRVEVRAVKSPAGALAVAASLKPLPLAQALAWEKSETLAKTSKRSITIERIDNVMAI